MQALDQPENWRLINHASISKEEYNLADGQVG
jgi:hypothetical protein